VFDLKVSSHLTRALYGRIGHSDEAGFGNKAANVFGVPSAHVANAKDANPQFSHANSRANLSALMNCLSRVARPSLHEKGRVRQSYLPDSVQNIATKNTASLGKPPAQRKKVTNRLGLFAIHCDGI